MLNTNFFLKRLGRFDRPCVCAVVLFNFRMTSPSKWDKARKTGSGPAMHGASSPRHDEAAAAASSDKGTTYLAYIGHRHNGSSLLEMAINKRPWWQMTSDDSRTDWNFCWSQKAFDWDSFYGRAPGAPKQVLNRIRGNGGITIKDRLVVNMRKYAKAAKLDPSKPPYLPMSFIVTVAGEDDEPSKVDNGLKHDYELRALRDAAEAYNQKGEKMWIVRQHGSNTDRSLVSLVASRPTMTFRISRRCRSSRPLPTAGVASMYSRRSNRQRAS